MFVSVWVYVLRLSDIPSTLLKVKYEVSSKLWSLQKLKQRKWAIEKKYVCSY